MFAEGVMESMAKNGPRPSQIGPAIRGAFTPAVTSYLVDHLGAAWGRTFAVAPSFVVLSAVHECAILEWININLWAYSDYVESTRTLFPDLTEDEYSLMFFHKRQEMLAFMYDESIWGIKSATMYKTRILGITSRG